MPLIGLTAHSALGLHIALPPALDCDSRLAQRRRTHRDWTCQRDRPPPPQIALTPRGRMKLFGWSTAHDLVVALAVSTGWGSRASGAGHQAR